MPAPGISAVAAHTRACCGQRSEPPVCGSPPTRKSFLMPAWPEQRTQIGARTKRIDAPAKVTGTAKYSSDVQPQGWLYGMILRSRWPKARITSINLDKARQIPGIRAAVLVREGERTV